MGAVLQGDRDCLFLAFEKPFRFQVIGRCRGDDHVSQQIPAASMHMLCRKDLNSAELEYVGVSQSPRMVVAANGDLQTKEEATVHDKG